MASLTVIKMCQTLLIPRILIMVTFTTFIFISSVIQPSSISVNAAEFGEACAERPKLVQDIQSVVQIPTLTADAESPFVDYMTYENPNQFQIQVDQTAQATLGQKDESHQPNYFRYNEQPLKSDNQFQIRLSRNNYRMTNNLLKIASSSLTQVGVVQPIAEGDKHVVKLGFNPNFKQRTSSSLLRPLYETFVENQFNQKNAMTLFTGDEAFSRSTFRKSGNPFSTDSETSSPSPIFKEMITQPISELTTNPSATSIKMTSLHDRTTSTISGSNSWASSENFKLISSTLPFSTIQYQEVTPTDQKSQSGGNEVGPDTQDQTLAGLESQNDTSGKMDTSATTFSSYQTSTRANEVGESSGESLNVTSNETSAGSTDSGAISQTSITTITRTADSTTKNDTYSELNMTFPSTTPSEEVVTKGHTSTELPPSSPSVEIDYTTTTVTPESIMGTSQVGKMPSSAYSPSITSTSKTWSSTFSNANTDAENITLFPNTKSMTTISSHGISSSSIPQFTDMMSDSPSSAGIESTETGTLSPKSTTPLTPPPPTESQTTDKPQIDFSVTNPSSGSFTFTPTTSSYYSLQTSESERPSPTVVMSTTQIPDSISEPTQSFQMLTSTPNEDDNQFCIVKQWLQCDTTNMTCKCSEGMTYDEERSTCVSSLGKECQTGSGGLGERLCIKNAVCSSRTIGQVGICQCQDGFLPKDESSCLPGLGFPCNSLSSCYLGMKCVNSTCSCEAGWTEGKPGGLKCWLNYNSKCDPSDNLCNSFTFLNCSDTGKECKCEDPTVQMYDTEVKACVAIANAKCMLKDDSEGRRIGCGTNSECKVKTDGSNDTGVCECLANHENDWKGNCHPKGGRASSKQAMTEVELISITICVLKIHHVLIKYL